VLRELRDDGMTAACACGWAKGGLGKLWVDAERAPDEGVADDVSQPSLSVLLTLISDLEGVMEI
jgi:hypothetical protein